MATMKVVAVEIKGSEIIKPEEKTWTGTIKLSELDISFGKRDAPMLYLYRPNKDWDAASISRTLKESLRKVLVHFYPFAGRFRTTAEGQMVVDVDDTADTWGVPLVEARTDMELLDLGDDLLEADHKGLFKNLFSAIDLEQPVEMLPLLKVMITHFRCGAVAVAINWSHVVVDGAGAGHFYTEWTRIARGDSLATAPVHDHTLLRARDSPKFVPEFIHHSRVGGSPSVPHTTILLPLSKSQVDKLKEIAGQVTNARPYTRYEVLAAHVWRCVSKTKWREDKEISALAMAIDIRKRINPPIPATYNGNSAVLILAKSKFEELVSNPLAYACGIVRNTIDKVTDETIRTYLDYQKSLNKCVASARVAMTPEGHLVEPEVGLLNWMNISFNNLDFGWGKEAHMASLSRSRDGIGFVRVGGEEGSVITVMCLQVHHVDKFKEYFFHEFK